MTLTKQQLLERRVPIDSQTLSLPRGGTVRVLPIGAKLFREYRRSLRDEDGKPIPERSGCIDELLVGRILLDDSGSRMFSDEEILAGCFDNFHPSDMDALVEWAWSFVGDGDREKKFSPTPSGEPVSASPDRPASRHR